MMVLTESDIHTPQTSFISLVQQSVRFVSRLFYTLRHYLSAVWILIPLSYSVFRPAVFALPGTGGSTLDLYLPKTSVASFTPVDPIKSTPLITPTFIIKPDPAPETEPTKPNRSVAYAAAPQLKSAPAATGLILNAPLSIYAISQSFNTTHPALDLAAPIGEPIHAASNGCLTAAFGWNGGYGNNLIEDLSNGYTLRYAHLTSFAEGVSTGACVETGDIIGYVGSTGRSTGPHLHFELRHFNQPVYPKFNHVY